MDTRELPLVFFTIMAQMSVGCFVVLGVIHLFGARKLGAERVDRLSDPALYAIGPVMVLGLVVSILHLGNPVNALHTINHFSTSWLSREIFFGSAFAVSGAVFAVCQKQKWLTPLLRQLLAGITALLGLALVFVMSMVYMLPTVPGWDTWATPVTFFTTTFLLGSLAVGAAFMAVLQVRRRRNTAALDDETIALLSKTLRGVAIAAIALLGVEFVALPIYALQLANKGGAASQSAHLMLLAGGAAVIIRLALVFVGAGLLGALVYWLTRLGRERVMAYVIGSAFALVLASELLGRLLFYTSYARIGL